MREAAAKIGAPRCCGGAVLEGQAGRREVKNGGCAGREQRCGGAAQCRAGRRSLVQTDNWRSIAVPSGGCCCGCAFCPPRRQPLRCPLSEWAGGWRAWDLGGAGREGACDGICWARRPMSRGWRQVGRGGGAVQGALKEGTRLFVQCAHPPARRRAGAGLQMNWGWGEGRWGVRRCCCCCC